MRKCYTNTAVKLLIVLAVILTSTAANAADYKPMIRYDRVWECHAYEWGDHTVKYMKFDGTEDVDGKTYHRIVTFAKSIVETDASPEKSQYEFILNLNENEGYLREENGKVYTLAATSPHENHTYIPDKFNTDEYNITEVLLYDFNCSEGGIYNAFSNCMNEGATLDFRVKNISYESIDGEECICQEICADEYADMFPISHKIIEGIGPADSGCLNYNEFQDSPTRPWAYNYINRVFDSDGRTLYETADCLKYTLPAGIFSSVALIENDVFFSYSEGLISFGGNCHLNILNLYDARGVLVESASGKDNLTISTHTLAPGIYIAEAQTEGYRSTHKIMVGNR